jgi:hypothetical protein
MMLESVQFVIIRVIRILLSLPAVNLKFKQ